MTQTMTNTKKVVFGVMLGLILSMMAMFMAPVESHAGGLADLKVSVTDKGGITADGITAKDVDGKAVTTSAGSWNLIIAKYKVFIVGIAGIGTVSMIAFFIVNFMKLGASSGNPQARSQALAGVLWTGLAAAGLGAVTIIVGIFYNALK